jgi:hypothetical protein
MLRLLPPVRARQAKHQVRGELERLNVLIEKYR